MYFHLVLLTIKYFYQDCNQEGGYLPENIQHTHTGAQRSWKGKIKTNKFTIFHFAP